MFSPAHLPGLLFLRISSILLLFTTVFFGGLWFFTGVNAKAAPSPPVPNYYPTMPVAPANDNYSDALPLLGNSGFVLGTNVGATKETNEQPIKGVIGSGSVWYRWQAPLTARYVFTTSKSQFNTLLAVYTGTDVLGPQIVSDDDDSLCSVERLQSKVGFNATAGVIYHIVVDGKFSSGDITLRWGRSATINVLPRTYSSTPPSSALSSKIEGDICLGGLPIPIFNFGDVPVGGNYTVTVQGPNSGYSYVPDSSNPSISPLTGDVTLIYYLKFPAYTLSGVVQNLPSTNMTGVSVTCVSSNGGLISQTANIAVGTFVVTFECKGLPANTEYIVAASKVGYTFDPATRVVQLFNHTELPPFSAIQTSQTITGRVTTTNSLTGVGGVTVTLAGSQSGSTVTNSAGNYSFSVPHGGNYTLTPSHPNFTFGPSNTNLTNVTSTQTVNFAAFFTLALILDESGPVAALDSVSLTRDPFPVLNDTLLNLGLDRNTRVTVFISSFQLGPGELPSSVVINLVGSNSQSFDIPAEDVRPATDSAFTQVTFRLPNTLASGICTLFVKARGLTSNLGSMRIK